MSPYVNTDVKMPQSMLEALSLHETYCVMSNINTVTELSAKEWLAKNFNQKIADAFKSEYLY
jgi:hypothetical protein